MNNKGGQTQVPKKDAKKKKKDAKKKKIPTRAERKRFSKKKKKERSVQVADKLCLDGHDIEEWLGERKEKFPDMDETESNVLKLILEVPDNALYTLKHLYKARFGKELNHPGMKLKAFVLKFSGVVVTGMNGNVYIKAPKKVELIDLTLCSDSE